MIGGGYWEGKLFVRQPVGAAGRSITVVAALTMLFVSVAALLLANSLRGQLEDAQGRLQDMQSELQTMQESRVQQQEEGKGGAGQTVGEPGAVNKTQSQNSIASTSQDSKSSAQEGQDQQQAIPVETQTAGGYWLPYLLLLCLGLMVLASLVIAVTSALALVRDGSSPGRSRVVGAGASAPSHTGTSNLEHASPLEDGRWIKLAEECVDVVDELDEHMGSFDASRREVAGHVVLRLEEILGRSGVEVISSDAIFDRARHKPNADQAATDNGVAIRETLSPGFAVGSRVLRRARVQLE